MDIGKNMRGNQVIWETAVCFALHCNTSGSVSTLDVSRASTAASPTSPD